MFSLRRIAILALCTLFVLPAFGEEKFTTELIPRSVLFGNPERADPQISPDGKQLAYLAPVNGVLNVWVRTLGKTDDRAVTSDTNRGIRNFIWQYDDQHLLYLQDAGGDENWRLYQTDIATKQTKDLTPFDKVRVDIVAYSWKTPDAILVQMNQRDPKVFDVHRVDLKTGKVTLDTQNPGDVASWQADNSLEVRAAQVSTDDGGTIIRVRNDVKSPWRDLMKWGPDETFGGVGGFTPDNRSLWVMTSLDANAARLLEIDIASGKQKVVSEDPQFDVRATINNPKTNALEAISYAKDKTDYIFVDPKVKSDFAVLSKVHDGEIDSLSQSLDDNRWIVGYISDDAPEYWYLYDRPTQKATLLFSNRPQLEKYKLSKMQPIEYTARDGMKLYGYLSTPAGMEAKNLPMVVFVHGGPWGRDEWGYNRYAQWLANRGYAVLQVNFRGSTGYGKKYVNAGDRQWAGSMHTDLLDGKDWVVKQGIADPAKVCIMGGSYGGYATLAGVTFAPDAFACGVDIVGPSNLNTLLKTIPPYWSTILSTFHKRMGDSEAVLTSQSPLFKADQIKVPLLIGQGKNDPRVNVAESNQIVAAMRKNNKPVEYYIFPDEGHGFAKPTNNMAFNAASEEFLAKYLGGRAEPPSEAESKLLASIKQ
ncbi:peptidase S9, prolyl oligopeptidase [Candidatus Koribacter versatilis Ellin345]|uniref:Peptidase S9, prolyl oligopeptidase n=1 Tax=Koribacter versatilis (strain Ellin345) TaxID=204669 RepID=Q1IQB9_KORVE|nr:S9 family peptidase [Candidatus Koribacter versatilis]ABF40931.1 peptidase S9, prolyl oligopeptidase [Candidatus Koribacter versatilis Ellin345]